MKKWIIGWSLAGLIAPIVHLSIYLATGYTLGEGIFIFWPGAIGLMVLNDQPPFRTVVFIWACCVGTNVILYAVVGILFCGLSRMKSEDRSEGEEKK